MSSNFQPVLTSITLGASASYEVNLYMENLHTTRVLVEATAATTGTLQGVTVKLQGGVGTLQKDAQNPAYYFINLPAVLGPVGCLVTTASGGPRFGDNFVNGDPDAVLTAFTPSSGSPQTKRLYFYLDQSPIKWGDWTKITFYNRDAVAYTLSMYASIS